MKLWVRIVALAVPILAGILIGVGYYTFDYAHGWSYFSTDPEACNNCHVMNEYYDSWLKGPHHTAAKCVDCHLPHEFIPKYIAKADNGYRHSWAFTFMDFHEPIQITPRNARILQDNCVQCHQGVTHQMFVNNEAEEVSCVHCHRGAGHGH